jgi:hypothetical protein
MPRRGYAPDICRISFPMPGEDMQANWRVIPNERVGADASSAPRAEGERAGSMGRLRVGIATAVDIALRATPGRGVRGYSLRKRLIKRGPMRLPTGHWAQKCLQSES